MSIYHDGTNTHISGASTAGTLNVINLDGGETIEFAQLGGGIASSPPAPSLSIGNAAGENSTVNIHNALIEDMAKPSVATAVTLTIAKPFISVTSDATVGGFPFGDQTTALTLPAWEEGLFFRIAYKAVGASSSPLGRAQITIEASGSEVIVYTGGASAGSTSSVMIAESERSGPVFGICEAYAAETFADASNSAKVEVWIIQTGDRTAIQT